MSDLVDDFKVLKKGEKDVEKSLASALVVLIKYLGNVKEFNKRELLTLSLINSDKFFKELFSDYFIENRKHLKRKHSKEIQSALKEVCKAVGTEYHLKKLGALFRGNNNRSLF